ncbi:MAG TPA: Fur family transcriptional regulator [Gaiellaceae bacterium]|nr:Fur family transcriptional regulator [Gaiellaceae bacterium]
MTGPRRSSSARLADAGVRATRQRLLVLETLAAEPDDATAQEIYARLRQSGERVGLATVYRTLSLLSEHGVVDEFAHHPGETCYRLCGEGHHHHLVCVRCHGVAEIEECELDEWLARASDEHGFLATSHTLEVTGICAACRAA